MAETRYLTDQSQITMRSGESTRHKIIRLLPSGEAVEELQVNKATGYSQVRTADGATGYVLTHQLLSDPIARDQLAKLEAHLAELQQAPDQLATKLAQLQSVYDKLQMSHNEIHARKNALEQELASIKNASANVVRITQERSELSKKVADLTRQVGDLQQQNRDLENQTTQRWFLIGAGVIAGGILIGIALPHLQFRRRKNTWGSL